MVRKAPPSKYPVSAASSYAVMLNRLIREMHSIYWVEFQGAVKAQIYKYRGDSVRFDGPLENIMAAFERAKRKAKELFSLSKVRGIAKRWLNNLNSFNRRNIGNQIKIVMGIDPTENEPWLSDFMESAIAENVSYITTIPEQYHDRVVGAVLQGVKNGQSLTDMATAIRQAYNVSENRARFIARDQTASITGQLTRRRHEAAGVKRFVWSTSNDERVRMEHATFDGKEFAYADGAGPKKLLPSQDYNCRCVAQPIFE